MSRKLVIALALMPASGCAITDRLDLTNQQLRITNQQLNTTNEELRTANGQIALSNQQLAGALQRLDETNRRIEVIDQAILKFPGLRPDPAPAAPSPAQPLR